MKKILTIIENISKYSVWGGGILLFATSFFIALEVFLRKLFSISMGGTVEISGYVLAISCSWAFSFALFRKAHIRVDTLYVRFPKLLRYFFVFFSLALFLIYMSILSYYAFISLKMSIARKSVANTPLQTPLWIPQSIWLLGLIIFTFTIFLLLLGTIYYLAEKDELSAQKISSAMLIKKEIEEVNGSKAKLSTVKGGER